MFKFIRRFFDKLEDKVRGFLSHYPFVYAIIGGVGTVFVWRGLWHVADFVSAKYLPYSAAESSTVDFPHLADGLFSLGIGAFLLLITGLFVATFIGDHIIVSGLKHEKKIADKTMEELEEEENIVKRIHDELHNFSKRLETIEKKLEINSEAEKEVKQIPTSK